MIVMPFVITVNNWNYRFRNYGAAHFSPINPPVADIYSSNWSIAWTSRGCIFSGYGGHGEVSLCRSNTYRIYTYMYICVCANRDSDRRVVRELLSRFLRDDTRWANCIFDNVLIHTHRYLSQKIFRSRTIRSAQRDVWDLGFGILDSPSGWKIRRRDSSEGEVSGYYGLVYVRTCIRENRELS